MDDKSAGFVGYARWSLNVLLSWGSEGVQGEGKSGGSLLFFLGAVATATLKKLRTQSAIINVNNYHKSYKTYKPAHLKKVPRRQAVNQTPS
jgi:hypothetical protein